MEPMFYVGQKVVCVDSKSVTGIYNTPSIEGKQYTINGIQLCKCGKVEVDVGFISEVGTICLCGHETDPNTRWYFYQTRFVPLSADGEIEEQIKESLNEHLKIKI